MENGVWEVLCRCIIIINSWLRDQQLGFSGTHCPVATTSREPEYSTTLRLAKLLGCCIALSKEDVFSAMVRLIDVPAFSAIFPAIPEPQSGHG